MRVAAGFLALFVGVASATALMAPSRSFAIEYYTGKMVAECHMSGLPRPGKPLPVTTNVTASIGTGSPNWSMSMMTYQFSGASSRTLTGTSGLDPSSNGKVAHFAVAPGSYTVTAFGLGGQQGVYHLTVADCSPGPGPRPSGTAVEAQQWGGSTEPSQICLRLRQAFIADHCDRPGALQGLNSSACLQITRDLKTNHCP